MHLISLASAVAALLLTATTAPIGAREDFLTRRTVAENGNGNGNENEIIAPIVIPERPDACNAAKWSHVQCKEKRKGMEKKKGMDKDKRLVYTYYAQSVCSVRQIRIQSQEAG
ncbi:hypothetical protein K491DRAFT_692651 [Lophiostoma macrostomum CBS 122681]|uniref:Uncharacterized protein n=1 Tax=Lophiostoma macrostomum CBS 122681 TaxID=1314788 RepID=A0A6A6T8Z9_9PLEO|nr:hypothetical protein K491DRAFT_692651 [Lophiostoma macrostomum CBS 122681]